ncbi:MAG: molybdenum cofactor biosynthesis protein MoaE [Bacteroidota bacterium]|nr:molybdenum cofactor biosynthesis protein MoaE [Bacteroidota bacterium]
MQLVNGPVPDGTISELIAKSGKKPGSAAHSLFIGRVAKDMEDGKPNKAVEYAAVEEMVIYEADKIHKTILSEFPDVASIEIVHSRGTVPAGETYLCIIVSAPDSQHAIKACTRAIELIGQKLPVLRKEIPEIGAGETEVTL